VVKRCSPAVWLSLNDFFRELQAGVLRIKSEKLLACCGFGVVFFGGVEWRGCWFVCFFFKIIYKLERTASKLLPS